MPRDWADLVVTPRAVPAGSSEPAAGAESERGAGGAGDGGDASERRAGVFRRLRESMARTREAFGAEIQATLAHASVDVESWEHLEETLIMADVGAPTTAAVVGALEVQAREEGLDGPAALTERLIGLLAQAATSGDPRIDLSAAPAVVLMAGVNGTGKTTTVGKLAWYLRRELGLTVLLGAADTFRAAATEQLEGWARRAEVEIVTGAAGSDPGAVAFETVTQARARGVDVALIDTAGRLHTQDNLMAELVKIRRVVAGQCEGAPHETLLTVDASTGQNGLRQARLFAEAIPVDGIVLTKLDGTAKGGIALAIARELGIPVKLIGTGEGLEDLRPFDPEDFARALLT